MKKLLTRNLGMKLLSLFLAVFFWIAVINIQDPLEERTFRNIKVNVVNSELAQEKGKIITASKGDYVDVVLEGKRKELDSISREDIIAEADATQISIMDNAPISVSVDNHPNVVWKNTGIQIALILDDYDSHRYPCRVNAIGTPYEGYVVGELPTIWIEVEGAKTVLASVHEVVLDVGVEGKDRDFTMKSTPVFMDSKGNRIDAGKLKTTSNEIDVTVPILPTKRVYLEVYASGTPAEGYEVLTSNISFQPTTITIAGTKESLAEVKRTVTIDVDVTDKSGMLEENLRIRDFLPADIRIPDSREENMAVSMNITPFVEKKISIPLNDVAFFNIPNGLELEKPFSTEPIVLTVKCKAARATNLDKTGFKVSLDLNGYSAGQFKPKFTVEGPQNVFIVNMESPTITLKEEEKPGYLY